MQNKYVLFLFSLIISSADLFSIPVPNGYYLKQSEINPVTGEKVLLEKESRLSSRCIFSQFVYYPHWTSVNGYFCGYSEYSKNDIYLPESRKICKKTDWHYLNWNFEAYRIIAPCSETENR